MSLTLMGKKKGMTQVFDEKGNVVVCTVIQAEPNIITQVLTKDKAGYSAVQLCAFQTSESKAKNVAMPQRKFYEKKNLPVHRKMKESRVQDATAFSEGQQIGVEYFSEVNFVDVCSISKGKGYQGVMKRHNFAGGPAAHGSGFHRHGGSTGMRSTPGRCLPGQKMAGRMGGEKVTVQNLKVIMVDADKKVILVEGSVPGARESTLYIAKAKKKVSGNENKK